MPTDPVYNPHLPSSSIRSTPVMGPSASWSGGFSSSRVSDTSWSALSAGLCAGAFVGAAIALMFAPMRGTEVRRSLRRYASDSGERLSRVMESGRSVAEDAMHRAASLVDQGRSAFRTGSSTEPAMRTGTGNSPSQPLTASVAEISGVDRRFEEPLGG